MDTPTLVILSLILVITTVVVFFGVRWLLTSAFVRPPRVPKVFLSVPDQINHGQNQPMPVQTLSSSDDFRIVDLPRKFTGQGENIDMDAMCWLRGKPIRDCIKNCKDEECASLRQKPYGWAQQW